MNRTDIVIEACRIKDELARKHWEFEEKLKNIRIVVNPRLRTTAGIARHGSQEIGLSLCIFQEEENREHFENTILHEISHLLVGCGNGHNATWKAMHRKIGGNGERCHKMEAGVRQVARDYKAVCNTCGEEVPITKRKFNNMNKALAKGARYRHKACGGLYGTISPYQTCENAHLGIA